MTALQELIKRWKTEMGSYIPNAPIYKAFIEEAETYLEKEKQQIIDAYEWGVSDEQRGNAYENGNEYYKNTYEK